MLNNNTILRSQLRFKSDLRNLYAEEVNKIALNSNDDKRLQTFDRVTTYPYEQMLIKYVKVKGWQWKNTAASGTFALLRK